METGSWRQEWNERWFRLVEQMCTCYRLGDLHIYKCSVCVCRHCAQTRLTNVLSPLILFTFNCCLLGIDTKGTWSAFKLPVKILYLGLKICSSDMASLIIYYPFPVSLCYFFFHSMFVCLFVGPGIICRRGHSQELLLHHTWSTSDWTERGAAHYWHVFRGGAHFLRMPGALPVRLWEGCVHIAYV